jgi:lipopolysaccharide transport system permease protein
MRKFSASPVEMFACIWQNRELIKASTKREVLGRYRGSFLGLLWSFFNPLFMLIIFTFVFSVIFQARWGGGTGSKTEFAMVLFAGLIVFNLFAECINRAPNLILSNANYVKKVVFPLEILPFVGLLTALFHALISLGVWFLAYFLFFGVPNITALYIPLLLLPFCLFLMGLSWALASLGVFLRDLSQFIGVLTTALLFMSPIFYPVSAFPEDYRFILYLNPLTAVVDQARDVLFWGKAPDFFMLGIYWMVTLGIAWLGFAWFQNTRKGFSDVI